jgi:hypothetical protein
MPKLPSLARRFPQLHAFAQEKTGAPALRTHVPPKTREIIAAHSVEKTPSCKIYFRKGLFLLLTTDI